MTTSKLTPRTLREAAGTNPLLRHVARWVRDRAVDYGGDLRGPLRDLFYGGCESGMVSHLVYYKDTVPFAKRFFDQIIDLAVDEAGQQGEGHNALVYLGQSRAANDIGGGDQFYNFLAWWGFETAARRLADLAGVPID